MQRICRIFGTNIHPTHIFYKIASTLSEYDVSFEDGFIELRKNISKESIALIVEYLNTFKLAFDVCMDLLLEEEDIKNARYVRLAIKGTYSVNEDDDCNPLNSYTELMCNKCFWHTEESIPKPYLVNAKLLKKRQQIYYATNGIFVVTERLKKVFEDVCMDEVIIGEAKPVGEGKFVPDEKLYWIKPKNAVYTNPDTIIISQCEQCGRPIEMRLNYQKTKTIGYCSVTLDEVAFDIESKDNYDIITETNWAGRRIKEVPMRFLRNIYISSDFYYRLKELKINGIMEPDAILV